MVVVKDERKRGLGETRAGTYRRDYRTKLQTKVIRPWRLPDVYSGLPEDYVRSVLFFSAREIMDCDRTNAPFPPPLSTRPRFYRRSLIRSRLSHAVLPPRSRSDAIQRILVFPSDYVFGLPGHASENSNRPRPYAVTSRYRHLVRYFLFAEIIRILA